MEPDSQELLQLNRELQQRLDEAEETLRALRSGEVDAILASGPDGDRVYTLKGADEAYRVIVQGMGEGAVTLTTDGLILFSNEKFASLIGTPLERVIGSSIHDFVAKEDAPLLSVLLSGGAAAKAEIRMKNGPAVLVPAQVTANSLSFDGTRCVCLIVTDLTEQKRNQEIAAAQQALSESEARLRALGDNLPEGAIYRYRQDVHGNRRFEFISAGIERLTGVPAAEFMVDAATEDRSMAPQDLDRLNAARALSSERLTRFEVEVRHIHRPTGETRWSLLRAIPSRCPDGSTLWDGIALDITERKRIEEALRASEARLRMALDAAQIGTFEFRPRTREILCDEQTRKIWGLPPRASYDQALARIHPDDRGRVDESIAAALAPDSSGSWVSEYRIISADGSIHWATAMARVTFEGEGEGRSAARVVGIQFDITDRKHSEQQLRQAQKMESLGLLAGGVAHDFNNLLVGVIGNASMAQEMLPPQHPAAELLAGVLRSGEQAAQLTRQMLAYSGKGHFVVEPLDLSAQIAEMSGLVRSSIPKKIALLLDLEQDLPPVEADRGQVQQVFMNLVLNAAEAIGSGEGVIKVGTGVRNLDESQEPSRLASGEARAGKFVYLEVRDTGCGMDEATQARIFDPFFSTKFVGRGLGLAAVAGIVRGHKGAITVTSAPGQGSRFTVLFPATERAAPAALALPPEARLTGTGTVLVVDDEEVVRRMAAKALQRHGYQVLSAASAVEAIDVCRRHPGEIAAVVLDLSMPGMGGEEVLPELRKLRPSAKFLISSGYSEAEVMRLFQGQRVSGFIQKPYHSKGLAEKVKICVG